MGKIIRFSNSNNVDEERAVEVPEEVRISLAYGTLRFYIGKKCIAAFKASWYYDTGVVNITQNPIKQRICHRCKEPKSSLDGGLTWQCSINCGQGTRRINMDEQPASQEII